MEKNDKNIVVQKPTNYYKLIKKNLEKQNPNLSEKETAVLCRETVFAPNSYKTEINEKPVPITAVRQNLADFIERDNSSKDFIPYSLDAQIADLIEQSSCETSSMNEYYRWVGVTSEIVRNTSDGQVTHRDLNERKTFINMSYDREAEILLCLALYQGAGAEQNREKIDILRFKLARLREMRSIVSNTQNHLEYKRKRFKETLSYYSEYCKKLSQEVYNSCDMNLNLKLNINLPLDEDLDENYPHLEYLQASVLYMMRMLDLPNTQNQRTENNVQKEDSRVEIIPQQVKFNETRER